MNLNTYIKFAVCVVKKEKFNFFLLVAVDLDKSLSGGDDVLSLLELTKTHVTRRPHFVQRLSKLVEREAVILNQPTYFIRLSSQQRLDSFANVRIRLLGKIGRKLHV